MTNEELKQRRKAIEKLNSEMIKSEVRYLMFLTALGVFSLIMFLTFAPTIGEWVDRWPWYYQAGMAIISFILVFLYIKKQNR